MVSTYAALAALGSPLGKGGFDADSVEAFLQGSGVQYVLLDEVHKVVENERSVTHGVVEVFVDWLRDGSLRGLIGFSGTAEGYRDRFERLGLSLVYTVPMLDLIGAGFIAPYAEFGVPFAYSDRERRIADLVRAYGAGLVRYFALLGPGRVRDALEGIRQEERLAIARDRLGLGAGRPDRDAALERRFRQWAAAERFGVADAAVLQVVQVALGLSDEAMVEAAVTPLPPGDAAERRAAFRALLGELGRSARSSPGSSATTGSPRGSGRRGSGWRPRGRGRDGRPSRRRSPASTRPSAACTTGWARDGWTRSGPWSGRRRAPATSGA